MSENEKISKEKRVEVFIPKAGVNDEPNLFVSINGTNYLLPRGKKSRVPAEVAQEIERAQRAQDSLDAAIDQLLEAGK